VHKHGVRVNIAKHKIEVNIISIFSRHHAAKKLLFRCKVQSVNAFREEIHVHSVKRMYSDGHKR
jgi:hypothetical protein